MKKIICLLLLCITLCGLTSCAEADAIKNGIKDKLPKPEEYEVIEAVMERPSVGTFEHSYSLLVVQEVKNNSIIAVIDGTNTRYSIPNWFGELTIEPGTYLVVEHADNSLPTSPMQFGFIYSMQHHAKSGNVTHGIKP